MTETPPPSPTSRPENDYRLVLFDAPEDPKAVRDVLCGITGMHPTDAMQWVARAPGVFPRPLAEGEVRELLDALYEMGIPAEAWRADALPNLAHPRTVHEAACLDDGLRISGLRGEPAHWVPWDRLELIAAGWIAQEDEFRDVVPPGWVQAASTGLNALFRRPGTPTRRQRAMRITRDPIAEAILVRAEPRIAFRVVSTQMKYTYLGERLRPTASENFPIFLEDVRDHATGAYVTSTTSVLLAGEEPGEALFPNSAALLDYATNRLLWSWYRKDRDRRREAGEDDDPDRSTQADE